MNAKGNQVVAIGLDAAAPALVRDFIERGYMPNLEALLSNGKWMRVQSTASIGSGSVWPTFITGDDPSVHGVYGEWVWQPETMDIIRYRGKNLVPFWKDFAKQGLSVGILDLPFMPMVGLSDGFEVSEWGPHDVLEGKTEIGPNRVAKIVEKYAKHPLSFGTLVSGPDDYKNLQKLGDACVNGARLRGALARDLLAETKPQLSLIVFPETHRCGHYLWHTAEPEHPLYRKNGFAGLRTSQPTLANIYQEIDRQIGEILKVVSKESPILVFSLHGMQPAHGVPALLGPLLCEAGFTRFAGWHTQSWRARSKALMAYVKRQLPSWVKKLYYSITPPTTTHLLARSTMLPPYDWNNTRAFVLPTDQHGWIRINLIGREAKGIVPLEQYEETCNQLEKLARDLTSEDGRPLVREVIRTAHRAEDALAQRIPDIVIHWGDAVFSSPLRIKGSATRVENVGKKYVGQHSLEGFCILSGPVDAGEQEMVHSKNMHRLISRLLLHDKTIS